MIEFSGELSKDSKNFLIKKNILANFLSTFFVSIIFTIFIIILAISVDKLILLFLTTIFLANILSLIPPNKKTLEYIIPSKIIISKKDEILSTEGIKFNQIRNFSNIKIIYDFGEFYYFTFYFPNKCAQFLCQKDLLVQGDLNEFETYFKDKIVKRLM